MTDREIREKLDRRWDAAERMQKALLEVIADPATPVEVMREIAKLLADEVGYLGDHMPVERQPVARLPCSGSTYHLCSFSSDHDPGCKAAGGDGTLRRSAPARSCEPGCDQDAPEETWCQNAGFDCATCERTDRLLALLASLGKPL